MGFLIRCGVYTIQKKLESDACQEDDQGTEFEQCLVSSSVQSEVVPGSVCWLESSFMLPVFDRSLTVAELAMSSYQDRDPWR